MSLFRVSKGAESQLMREMSEKLETIVRHQQQDMAQAATGERRSQLPRFGERDPIEMIAMRFHLTEGQMFPFEYISCYFGKGKAFVFVVANGAAVTLEDDHNLFPSDTLIGQLRLLGDSIKKPEPVTSAGKNVGGQGFGQIIQGVQMPQHQLDAMKYAQSAAASALGLTTQQQAALLAQARHEGRLIPLESDLKTGRV